MSNPLGTLIGNEVKLYASNVSDHTLRHKDFEIWLDKSSNDGQLDSDSKFIIVGGITGAEDGSVSFKSKNYPNHYLRHRNNACFLEKFDGSDAFKADATWKPEIGLAGSDYSFSTVNFPDLYMRHHDYGVGIANKNQLDGNQRKDATWKVKIIKSIQVTADWVALKLLTNEAGGTFTGRESTQVGISMGETKSQTETNSISIEAGFGGSYKGVEAAVKTTATRTVSTTSEKTWQRSEVMELGSDFKGKEGKSVFLWQWTIYATDAEGKAVVIRTPNITSTAENAKPARLDN